MTRGRTRIVAGAALTVVLLAPVRPAAAGDVEVERATLVDAAGHNLAGGGSTTPYGVKLPHGAECQGDSANDQYRINSYVVPKALAPPDIAFDGLGPTPKSHGTYETFRQPLYDTNTTFFVSIQLENNERTGEPGQIQELPMFDFGVYSPGDLPLGEYHLGIACTFDNAVTRVWDTEIAVTQDPADEPAHIRWDVVDVAPSDDTGRPVVVFIAAAAVLLAAVTVLLRRRTSATGTTQGRTR